MRGGRNGIMSTWLHQERAEHARDLAAPQPFPLTGDGENTMRLSMFRRQQRDLAGALADARYRDWLANRASK